jgi:uncharacterized protein YraI
MKLKIRKEFLAALAVLLIASLACSTGSPAATQTPVVIVVTATNPPDGMPTDSSSPDDGSASATTTAELAVRSGPGGDYPLIGSLPSGTTIPVIGKNADGSWLQVTYEGNTGWISAAYTETSNLDGVPVVSAPPMPATVSSPTQTTSGGGGAQTAPSDSDIVTTLNIKSDNKTLNGVISYPSGDTIDQVYVNVSGFDSGTTSGNVTLTAVCSGEGAGNAKVFFTGIVKSGTPACNSTWVTFVGNDNNQIFVRFYLDSGGSAYVNWTLILSANN